jgi:hypothetical protein
MMHRTSSAIKVKTLMGKEITIDDVVGAIKDASSRRRASRPSSDEWQ